eukprot:TRINITY_DN2740_c2_g1_i1.p2 TRINITY_DN2740_c2_g1~~TRINITY_DN2740_c2_g1_i1.p2  ORF type:complete len:259 (+),score=30.30 TRINITY_DN2740_c2_g1_i1:105-779(+)
MQYNLLARYNLIGSKQERRYTIVSFNQKRPNEMDIITQTEIKPPKPKKRQNEDLNADETPTKKLNLTNVEADKEEDVVSLRPRRTLNVVAGLILDETKQKIFLAQRPEEKRHALLWEFPGGKLDRKETFKEAMVRELDEELGIQIDEEDVVPVTFSTYVAASHPKPPINILICLFHIKRYKGEPYGREQQEVMWVDKEEIQKVQMPPGDEQMLDIVRLYIDSLQ